jgi:hypothetical protein
MQFAGAPVLPSTRSAFFNTLLRVEQSAGKLWHAVVEPGRQAAQALVRALQECALEEPSDTTPPTLRRAH